LLCIRAFVARSRLACWVACSLHRKRSFATRRSRSSLAATFSLRYDNQPLTGIETTRTLTAVNLVYQLL
jgi:hypothetical protein